MILNVVYLNTKTQIKRNAKITIIKTLDNVKDIHSLTMKQSIFLHKTMDLYKQINEKVLLYTLEEVK